MKTITVGRSPRVEYPIAADSISRRHCRFIFKDRQVWLEDLGSTNGTRLNGTCLAPGERVQVRPNSEVVLGDEVLFNWKLIQKLEALAQPKQTSSWWSVKPRWNAVTFDSLRKVTSVPIVAAVVVILSLATWFGITYHTHQGHASEAEAIISNIASADNDIWSDAGQISYEDLTEYKDTVTQYLDQLNEPVDALGNSLSNQIFFSSSTESIRITAANIRDNQEERLHLANRAIEAVRNDHEFFLGVRESATSEVQSVASTTATDTNIEEFQDLQNQVAGERETIKEAVADLENEQQTGTLEGEAEAIRVRLYEQMIGDMNAIDVQLSSAARLLSDAIAFQTDHQRNLQQASANILDQSEGISAVYQRVQPIAQNVAAEVQPVRQAIQTLEEPVVSGRLLGEVTPLSLIKDIDPVTGRAVATVRDVADVASRLEDDIAQLVRNIEPLREAASDFRSAPGRSNALALNERAATAHQYVNSQRNLFDPLARRVDDGRSYVSEFERAISRAPRSAQNFLREFSRAANSMLSTLDRPVHAWRSNIDSTIDQLQQIEDWEEEYAGIISDLQNLEPPS